MTSSSKFHVRKPYFVRLEKLNEAWFGDLDRIDPSGFSRFGPPQEVVCFEFFVFFFWMFFFRNLQPINHIENLRVSIPPPKGKKKKNNLPPPPLKRDYYKPTYKSLRKGLTPSYWNPQVVCFFGGSSRAPHGRTLGAVWCRGARCPAAKG